MTSSTEGYCPTCHYLVELTEEGRLITHGSRTTYVNGNITGRTDPCTGTASFPTQPPGTEDPAVAFTSEERTAQCAVCHGTGEQVIGTEVSGRAYMIWHRTPIISQEESVCPGTWEPIEYV